MNIVKKLFNWLFCHEEPRYYYRLSQEAEVEKVTETVPEAVEELPIDEVDVPVFTAVELEEMKKADLFELAVNSGVSEVTKKDTKKVLIEKIVSHYKL